MSTTEESIEQALSAHRERSPFGEIRPSSAFYDLDESGRRQLFEEVGRARTIEAGLDPDRFSSTVHAVLRRLRP